MVKSRISLDGTWEFIHVDPAARPVQVRSIQVPGPWQAQFSDLRMKAGIGIYRREVEVPSGWGRPQIFLCFGAVFHLTRAWVNGALVDPMRAVFCPSPLT